MLGSLPVYVGDHVRVSAATGLIEADVQHAGRVSDLAGVPAAKGWNMKLEASLNMPLMSATFWKPARGIFVRMTSARRAVPASGTLSATLFMLQLPRDEAGGLTGHPIHVPAAEG